MKIAGDPMAPTGAVSEATPTAVKRSRVGARRLLLALRRGLGPLGQYRPGILRRDLARGFRYDETWRWPRWARVLPVSSPEEKLLLSLPLEGKVIYDIGAHVGAYALYFSGRVGPRGRVVAFEPQPENFRKLRRNLERNGVENVSAFALGLGASRERRTIFMLPGMTTTASMATDADTPFRLRAGEGRIEALDELIEELNLPRPDFLKMDVEGMEGEALRGARRTLRRWRPDLLIEVHGADGPQKRANLERIVAALAGLRYRMRHLESARAIVPGAAAVSASGHLFASAA